MCRFVRLVVVSGISSVGSISGHSLRLEFSSDELAHPLQDECLSRRNNKQITDGTPFYSNDFNYERICELNPIYGFDQIRAVHS